MSTRAAHGPVQVPGQLELRLDMPELTDELRAELAAHVLDGWQGMGNAAQSRTTPGSPTPLR